MSNDTLTKAERRAAVSRNIADALVKARAQRAHGDHRDPGLNSDDPARVAHTKAIVVVRELYVNGKVDEVKAFHAELKKQYPNLKLETFYQVPVEDGPAFYQKAVELAQTVGLRK